MTHRAKLSANSKQKNAINLVNLSLSVPVPIPSALRDLPQPPVGLYPLHQRGLSQNKEVSSSLHVSYSKTGEQLTLIMDNILVLVRASELDQSSRLPRTAIG
jgi:hypothetical protein